MSNALQEREIALQRASTSEEKLTALNLLAEALCEVDPQRSLTFCEEAYQLARQLGDPENAVVALLNRAWAEYCKADYSSSFMSVQEGLRQARTHHFDVQEFDALTILGNNYIIIGNRADALQCFTEALTISKRLENPRRMATALSNIGQEYSKIGDYKEALNHYFQALDIMRSTSGQPIVLVNILLNITENMNSLQLSDEAITFALDSLQIAQRENYVVGEAMSLLNLGNAYNTKGDATNAEMYYEQALARIHEANAPIYEGSILQDRALFLLAQGNTAGALTNLLHALDILKGLDAKPEMADAHQHLARVYQQMGDFAAAFNQLEHYQELHEQVFNEQADNRQKTLQALYEVEKARLEAETQFNQNLRLQNEIQQSEKIIAELDAYADNVAHDLRNPIGVIVGFGGLIEMNLENTLDEDNLSHLKNLLAAADKMNDIVEALLTLARTRQEAIMPQVVNMPQVLDEALARVQPFATKRGARIVVEGTLPNAMGNDSWLEEAFVNYINNAIKYGGTPPVVTISAAAEANGFIRYRVHDNGQGVDAEAQRLLFRKFERLGQHKIEGHGLGLTIVKNIVEKLGGQIEVESSGIPGEGSTFSFTLRAPNTTADPYQP
ncbi:MAG: tetratricopeptide repeat protein [Chloroflexi bacterium]|nr:tetratricopeptide repeat protein [Chloroflexota bacterium]MCC6896765.1 tetratricopeptide repeat protein [Anaerolineae bacterium]